MIKIQKKLLILLPLLIVIITSSVALATEFLLSDFPERNSLSEEQLIQEIQTFAVRIEEKIKNCTKSSTEVKLSCTNIYNEDRLRLSYLLALNANLANEIIKQDNNIRRIIYPSSFQICEGGAWESSSGNSSTIGNCRSSSDADSFLGAIFNTLPVPANQYYNEKDGTYHFGMAVEKALKSCDKDSDSGMTKSRVVTLNPHIKVKDSENIQKGYHEIGCNDILAVVSQFKNSGNIKLILQNNKKTPWLPFKKSETENIDLSQQERDEADKKPGETEFTDKKTNCAVTGLKALFICPPMRFLGGMSQAGVKIAMQSINPNFINKNSPGGLVTFNAWKSFRDLSNILLVIFFTLMIIAQITNYRLDRFHIKRILPRFIVAVVLVNLSFIIIQISTDVSNIIGNGLYDFFSQFVQKDTRIMDVVALVLGGGLAITGIATFASILILIPIIIAIFISVVVILLVIAFRDAAFITLVILAPIALVSLVFHTTERLYQIWIKLFFAVLLVSPSVGLLFGSGNLVSNLMYNTGGIMKIFSLIPLAVQFVLLPQILLGFIKNLPIIGNNLSSRLGALPGLAQQKYQKSNFHQTALANSRRNIQRSLNRSRFNPKDIRSYNLRNAYRGINKLGSQAINLINPGYSDLIQKTSLNKDLYEEIAKNSESFDPNVARLFVLKQTNNQTPNPARQDLINKLQNNLSAEQSYKLSAMENSARNNPDQLLAAMISMSADGKENYDTIREASNFYLKQGGDNNVLAAAFKEMEGNYKSEAQYETAALLKNALKISNGDLVGSLNNTNGKDISFSDEDQRINLVYKYLLKNNNWSKFEGYKDSSSAEAQAFEKLASDPLNQPILREIQKKINNNKGVEYIDRYL